MRTFLARVFVWLRRWRHRRGYGVHSPFAFQFIREVVFEKTPYYAYDRLQQEEKGGELLLRPRRDLRLLFRLANAQRAERAFVCADDEGWVKLYVEAARPRIEWLDALAANAGADFVVLLDASWEAKAAEALASLSTRSMLVVAPITGRLRSAWRALQADERIGVTFDLYDFGIVCLSPDLLTQSYTVNRAF